MKSPFQNPVLEHHSERNAFDLSRKALFSANFGQLIPFFFQEVQPGDHFEISTNHFTRTQPANSAAYIRANEHREFFFVPYRYLWSYWEQFITQVKDYHSSLMASAKLNQVPDGVPLLSLSQLINTFIYAGDVQEPGLNPDFRGHYLTGYDLNYVGNDFLRLFNMLGYGKLNIPITEVTDGVKHPAWIAPMNRGANLSPDQDYGLNPFRVLAYQKIFYDYYRKADWEGNNVDAYNIDQFPVSGSYLMQGITPNLLTKMWQIHCRPWKMDYFMSVRPREYWYGNTNSVGNKSQDGVNNGSLIDMPAQYLGNYGTGFANGENYLQLRVGNISVNQIRAAYAIDKYLRTTQLAGKHYDDQILAHFGVKPDSRISQEVQLLGAFKTPLVIGEVTSTADTAQGEGESASGSYVGEQFGKGIADGTKIQDSIYFDAKEHGIIMGIYSVGLEADYDSRGIDPFNIKYKVSDYYRPEFDDIGPHVLFTECSDLPTAIKTDVTARQVLGLVDPYLEYKTVPDRVYGEFCSSGSLRYWTASRTLGYNLNGYPQPNIVLNDFYISPLIVRNIFALQPEVADCLYVNDYTIVKAVRNMSVRGIPKLS